MINRRGKNEPNLGPKVTCQDTDSMLLDLEIQSENGFGHLLISIGKK